MTVYQTSTNTEYKQHYTQKTVKFGDASIMICGCFSYYGVRPIYGITYQGSTWRGHVAVSWRGHALEKNVKKVSCFLIFSFFSSWHFRGFVLFLLLNFLTLHLFFTFVKNASHDRFTCQSSHISAYVCHNCKTGQKKIPNYSICVLTVICFTVASVLASNYLK